MPPAEVVACRDCGTVSEVGGLFGGRCAECESEAIRGQLLDRNWPRSESGQFMCFDCGKETATAARYKSEPFFSFCSECIEADEFPDVKQIAQQVGCAELSRGR